MASILYVETNFPLSIAKGQDPDAEALLNSSTLPFQLVIPAVCFMEALSAHVFELKQRNKFLNDLGQYIREVRRDLTSAHAGVILSNMEQARISSDLLLGEIKTRLYQALLRLSAMAQIIELVPLMIDPSLTAPLLDDPTDELILNCIFHHAKAAEPGPKAFLSGNVRDFNQADVQDLLAGVGVKFFGRTQAAMGWLRAQGSASLGT